MVLIGCSAADCTRYLWPAQGWPAAVQSNSTHWRNAPLPRDPPGFPAEHSHGKAMLISEGCTPLTCTRGVLQRCNSLGRSLAFAGSSSGPVDTGGEDPRHPGQRCNHPEPCSWERGSLLPWQGSLHLKLTDEAGLRLFIQHLQEATRRSPQAPSKRSPLLSQPDFSAQSS